MIKRLAAVIVFAALLPCLAAMCPAPEKDSPPAEGQVLCVRAPER